MTKKRKKEHTPEVERDIILAELATLLRCVPPEEWSTYTYECVKEILENHGGKIKP